MPALTKIEERIATDAAWKKADMGNRAATTKTAERIPLVHVTTAEGFFTIVGVVPQELMPSDSASGRTSPRTLAAENMLGFGRCLYLYAGRASPEFGDVSFAFEPGCESGHKGAATPFDSGGLAAGHIKSKLPNSAAPVLKKFVEDSSTDLNHWRNAFSQFLAAYFTDVTAYWTARPCRHDPEGIFENPENGWRAWTFEIRFHEGHSICKRMTWSFTERGHGRSSRCREGP